MALALIVGACGGDDDADTGTGREATASDGSTSDASTEATPSDDNTAGPDVSEDESADAGDSDASAADVADGSGDPAERCLAIFPTSEVEAFVAEPVQLEADANASLGQLLCTWSTIDEAEDDLTSTVLTVQVFSGDPIPASSFIDPDVFDEVTMIDGVGELAFSEDSFGTSFYFLDDPVAGSLAYSEFDLGTPDAPKRHGYDDVEALFRSFHDRVT